jgi:hypothetical protein
MSKTAVPPAEIVEEYHRADHVLQPKGVEHTLVPTPPLVMQKSAPLLQETAIDLSSLLGDFNARRESQLPKVSLKRKVHHSVFIKQ